MTHPTNDHRDDAARAERVSELLERSSLGTAGARELRRRTDDRAARDAVIDSLDLNEAEARVRNGDRRAAARRARHIEQQLCRTISFDSDLSDVVRNYIIRYITYEAICAQSKRNLQIEPIKLAERFVLLQRSLVRASSNDDPLPRVLKDLPENHRNVFIARVLHGLSVDETADFLALTPRSVTLTERRTRIVHQAHKSGSTKPENDAVIQTNQGGDVVIQAKQSTAVVSSPGWYLVGHQTLATRVAEFVCNGGGLLIVRTTGSGKTFSFLAHALTLTDPGFKAGSRYREPTENAPVKGVSPMETIDIAVLAEKNNATDVTAALAEGLGITPPPAPAGPCHTEFLREHGIEYPQTCSGRWTVVVDGASRCRSSPICCFY
jgi:hypothetical protein